MSQSKLDISFLTEFEAQIEDVAHAYVCECMDKDCIQYSRDLNGCNVNMWQITFATVPVHRILDPTQFDACI